MKFTLLLAAPLLFLTLIAGPGAISQARQPDPTVPVYVDSQPLDAPRACTGRFKQHTLNHITTPAQEPVRMFDSNGSGLAVNDLDNDGDMDIVLANLAGPNAIFWNTGNLTFERQSLPYGDSRAVTIVDVNGDGRLDIVFSRRTAGPLYLRNDGPPDAPRFTQTPLPGVTAPAYALAWADLDQDGDLDLVTGSYDAELGQKLGDAFMFSNNAGVFYYQNQGDYFEPVRLAEQAQALAILLTDLNGDRRPDILVGNDFSLPDNVWLRQDGGWVPAEPFSATTHSTMSFDAADIDNNGRFELLATDMHPTGNDANTQAAWQPVMDSMTPLPPGDPQIME
ncbi:MAG: VCBS repeat-containing protein, partial [Chloroflexi bacterium]